jgi:tetratricopeptide (TPR) repeat protein
MKTTAKTQRRADGIRTAVSEAEYMTLLRNCQNIFIHIQHLSGGAMVHDASGRQRLLQMDEVAQLFLQLKNELSASTVYSKALITRMRADAALKQGNSKAAVVEFHDALRTLDSEPALDTDRLSRASILHSMGHAYRSLDMAAESEACYLEALGLYKRSFGRDHPTNFAVLHDLGALCEKDGYATEAAALYERSFAGRLKTLGQHAPETLSSMQDLASLKVSLGDLESALLLLERAVPALDTVFGLQNETTLNAMNKLSLLYQKLGLVKESRMICSKTIPHCKTIFGVASAITRDAVVRYIQGSDNFDFPQEILDVLDQYRNSSDPEALRVIHRLGRSYMDAGLNRDAADLFETLFEDLLVVRGPEAPETFDALSALCVSREHLDSVDKAILAYHQLVQMASATPDEHHSRKRISYAQKRIVELNRRREVLATERKEWGLHEPGKCENCGTSTKILCNCESSPWHLPPDSQQKLTSLPACKIFRFCSEPCHKASLHSHLPYCIPSVSLRESKSLAVKPRCPPWVRDQALSKICPLDRNRTVDVLASYTFYFDPRNFTTFRMKLSSLTNTLIIFSLDSDIQFATIDSSSSLSLSSGPGNTSSSPPTTSSTTAREIQWLTPQRQEAICYIPPESPDKPAKYVLVSPGKEMFKSAIQKRVSVRGSNGEKEHFRSLSLPDSELIEYAQGLLLSGYLEEAFMYVIEWEWK